MRKVGGTERKIEKKIESRGNESNGRTRERAIVKERG